MAGGGARSAQGSAVLGRPAAARGPAEAADSAESSGPGDKLPVHHVPVALEPLSPAEQAVASEVDATPAQVALAWLLAQGNDIAPIPGTKRVSRVEENTAADGIELREEQIRRLNDLTPAAGARHNEANMAAVDR